MIRMWVAAMHTSLHSWRQRILRSDNPTPFAMTRSVAADGAGTAELQKL
jgi:hypothetical protein